MFVGQLQNNVSSYFIFCGSQDIHAIRNIYDHSTEGIFQVFSQY